MSSTRAGKPDSRGRTGKLLGLALFLLAVSFACIAGASTAMAASAMPSRATLERTPGRVIVKYRLR